MRTTLTKLQTMRGKGEKIAVLTCYDASFAALLEAKGIDVLLVGDSLGMVLQGHETTLPVTLSDMVYHTACVARGAKQIFIISDMPFGTFQVSPQKTYAHAVQLMAAGAQMVKLEGGAAMVETVSFLTERGIPVCGHIGLTPQAVHQLGGYRVQGREPATAQKLLEDAVALERAGAGMIVLEAIPALLDHRATEHIHHRYWRGCRLFRPSAGAARHAGYLSGQKGRFRQELYAGCTQHSRSAGELCCRSKGG
jgi:3-methyl-2-oxobutanoate hydroxymethyltransferase